MTLEEFLIEWNKSCPQLLVHTSGSTGKPKPIWVSKQKMLNSARITCNFL
ncbi:MAG: O-succinylbenzoic acid--CoA ligase, partial [Prevotella sp.]|nr:O-succinylbenzoic acid--CoA ligase [Prevotella sp.]